MDTNNNNSTSVKRIDLTVNASEICEKGVEIVRQVRPEWSEKEIGVKIFTDGLTNRLIGCYLPENPSDKVLVRVFGEKTEIFIDRENELQIMVDLHKNSFGPPVYCMFNNGIVYGFEDGIILDKHLVRKPEIAFKIAEKMAKMHTLQILNKSKREALVFQLMRKFLDQLLEETLIDRELFANKCVSRKSLKDEVMYVEQMLSDSDSPVVFCHNDILPANIIYDESKTEIKFIDYEYGCYNYQAFDIGNHFNEYAGIVDFDETYLPDKEHQIKWIREYLKFYRHFTENSKSSEIEECDVDKLYIQVNQFAACSHLLWGIWALVQYQFSTHEFDYFRFGQQRLGLYFKFKEQFLKQ